MTRHAVLWPLLVFAAGCASAPPAPVPAARARPPATAEQATARQVLNADRVAQVRVGKTTRADVRRLFGYPTARRMTDGGDEVWIFRAAIEPQRVKRNPFTTRVQTVAAQRVLVLTFAGDGDVVTHRRAYVTGGRTVAPFRDDAPPYARVTRRTPPEDGHPRTNFYQGSKLEAP